ncbi:vacuolar sorting protein 9 domain [Striga asiatica]|uniref:Vacuolar sorting protein 9 domain n=1 Tax=Striga asiatica TaxID=4170 RepID=A0A5A7QX91_STRAF|nr:vacuolar sorting protein 9 domain [Striga asiatica]
MAPRAYPTLSLEFFSTVQMHEEGKYLTARLKSKEYKITNKLLNDIFQIDIKDPRGSSAGFKADPHWPLLSPCATFKATGASSSFVSDVVLGVVHKYICHTIFGKKESNIVSKQQVFILWSLSQGKSVYMLQYLKRALFDIRNNVRRGANLGHIVAEIVAHFNVQTDEPCMPSEWIGASELYHTEFIMCGHIVPVYERTCYINYIKALETAAAVAAAAAAGPSHTTAGTSGAPSQTPIQSAAGEGTTANDEPHQESSQLSPLMPGQTDAYSDEAPVWFSEYEARNDARLTAFTEQNDARWTSYVESNDVHWTEQTRRWNEFMRDNAAHWTAHDSRWDTWAERQYQQSRSSSCCAKSRVVGVAVGSSARGQGSGGEGLLIHGESRRRRLCASSREEDENDEDREIRFLSRSRR